MHKLNPTALMTNSTQKNCVAILPKFNLLRLFLILISLSAFFQTPSYAQSCANTEIRFQKLSTNQSVENGFLTNCAFDFTPMFTGGQTGITVYTHVKGQPSTPNSATSTMATNSSGKIMGCIVPSTTTGKTWDIIQNSTTCLAPSPKPVLNVIKLASQNPFVVGKTGQSYTINIYVSTLSNIAPINLTDVLPLGIVTSGSILGPTNMTGCPAAGATNLTGCTLPAGLALGNYSITVPVSVGATAVSGINVASASSIGAVCAAAGSNTTLLPCLGSTPNIGILDAVGESVSKPANSASTTIVSTNDKYPPGSQFNLASGSTCANVNINAANNVVSYTAPATGQTCTVLYNICGPAPASMSICKTATLTVTGIAPLMPTLVMTKSASQNPFVVGKSGQFYTINITVSNGPTSAPISLIDSLPTGIVTSGPITGTPINLIGCPAIGSSNLTGCILPAGLTNGTYAITLPVTISPRAINGLNIANASSSGALCAGATASTNQACSASTQNIGILDAINDTVFTLPMTSTNTMVANNDVMPPSSQFYLGAGSTCSGASMSLTGVASYTSPSAGGTCTVNYNLCAANQTACDTATLTVTSMLDCINANVGSSCIWYMIFEPNFYTNPAKYQNSYWATNPALYSPPIPRCIAPAPSTTPATVALTGHTSPRCMRKFIFVRRNPSLGDGYDAQLKDQSPPTIELFPPD
jgi:hypothetical protein